MKVSHTLVKIPHSQVSDYVKTDIAMSHLTCLGEIFPWWCHKVTYSLRKVTELCPNDIITLIDGVCQISTGIGYAYPPRQNGCGLHHCHVK
jgi:hypothetical protein